MNNMDELAEKTDDWKTKILVIGTVLGALVGLSGAYLLVKSAEKHGDKKVDVSPGEGLKISLLVMGLLRQVAQLGESD